MPHHRILVSADSSNDLVRQLRDGIASLQADLELEASFAPDVIAAAEAASARGPAGSRVDRTDIEFVTIDPATSRDLDQALFLERKDDGYRVRYAIADVAAFVTPGDPVDREAWRRGQTCYGADEKVPLYPRVLSEDAASLLPGVDRPALLWTLDLDRYGEVMRATVTRALVRSREKLSYDGVQAELDAGTASPLLRLLAEVGVKRLDLEMRRGGVSLPLPEQELAIAGDHWHLEFRALTGAEAYNAQISLMTGMAAARMMSEARIGLLRTLPKARREDISRLRRVASSLAISWPETWEYPEFVRSLNPALPTHAAMVNACTSVLRGSAYVAFDGVVPDRAQHGAVGAEYAHVTAPLRRLADRYVNELCVALGAGSEAPAWVSEALPRLPEVMAESGRTASRYERGIVDMVETGLLQHLVGDEFAATVVDVGDRDPRRGTITISDPAIEASVVGETALPLGAQIRVRLVEADVARRTVNFEWIDEQGVQQ